jgi:hypothetical protein
MRESNKTLSLLNGESKPSGTKNKLPKYSKLIHKVYGVDINGFVITVVVIECMGTRSRHKEFYAIQYREVNRVIDQNSKMIRQFSGIDARLRMDDEMVSVLSLLEGSRIAAEMRGNA